MLIWGIAGIAGLVSLWFSYKMLRRPSLSLEGYRQRQDERFREHQQEMQTAAFKMPSEERIHIVRAGLADLLRLADYPEGFDLVQKEEDCYSSGTIIFSTPEGLVNIAFVCRESLPPLQWDRRSHHCGATAAPGLWRVWNDMRSEDFSSVAELMCRFSGFLRGESLFDEEKPEFARRFSF